MEIFDFIAIVTRSCQKIINDFQINISINKDCGINGDQWRSMGAVEKLLMSRWRSMRCRVLHAVSQLRSSARHSLNTNGQFRLQPRLIKALVSMDRSLACVHCKYTPTAAPIGLTPSRTFADLTTCGGDCGRGFTRIMSHRFSP